MITTNWSKAAAIFDAVVDLSESDRRAYLTSACADNLSLRKDVEAMLLADAEASGIFSGPILGRPIPIGCEFEPSDRLGPYEIVHLIGRGGMGAVYLARRVEDFQRTVAVKVIDGLVPDRATFRRFLRERQILSSLVHPNIARLYDGGVTDSGMPYLVMEYVEGMRIDDYCKSGGHSLKHRLELFRDVCRAVSYAHRHLIVHRDLKPGNILVTSEGQVKLLDFGIAKQLEVETSGTQVTLANEVLATPHFACPEQLSGKSVSTSWDVFSLGKILGYMMPTKVPSNVSSRLHPNGSLSERLLSRESLVDIDSIIDKATAESEDQRYSSVGELLRDVECVLSGEFVSARELRGQALLASLFRRRFISVARSLVLVLLLALVASLFYRERDAANSRALIANGLSSYLVSIIKVVDPDVRTKQSISALEVLDEGTRQARANLPQDSPEYFDIIREIGSLYFKVGGFYQAQNLFTEVLSSGSLTDRTVLASTHFELGRVLHMRGSNDDAEIHFRKSLQSIGTPTASTASLYSDVLEELALVAVDQNELQLADSLASTCLRSREKWLGEGSPRYASAIRLIARVRWRARDFQKAEELYLKALAAEKTVSGSRSLQVASTLNDLGLVYIDMGQHKQAEHLLSQSLRIKEAVLGDEHPSYATTLVNLAPVISDQFGVDSAETIMRKVVSIFIGSFGVEHHEVATGKNNLALYLHQSGRLVEAEQEYRSALEIWESTVGSLHPDYLMGCHNLAIVLRYQERYAEAIDFYVQTVQGLRKLGKNYRVTLAGALNGLAKSYASLGDLHGAVASFRESLQIREEELPAGHWRIGTAMSLLGGTLALLGEDEEAERMLRQGLDILTTARGPDDSKTVEARARLEEFRPQPVATAG